MKKLFLVVIPFFLISCTSTLRYVKESKSIPPLIPESTSPVKIIEAARYAGREAIESSIETASFYSDEFNGRKTANGEIFNMNDLTAAHISYPFNTICRVTNIKNQKSVIVRINDRKPDTNSRAIDLSLRAAKEIEMINDGLAEVRVDILERGDK